MKGKRLRLSALAGWFGLALLCGVSLYLILAWDTLPTQIPGHFNAAGAIDRWGSRTELWVCPVVGLVLWGMLTLLELVLRRWNWEGEGISPRAAAGLRRALSGLMGGCSLALSALFSLITLCSAKAALLPGWFLPIVIAAFAALIGWFLLRVIQITRK